MMRLIRFVCSKRLNSPRSMCCIRFLTEAQSRSVTVVCQTSNKTSTTTTNPFLHNEIVPPRFCNRRVKTECSLSGNCLKESVVYQATVSTEDHNPPQTYVGLTENSFKTRYSNHKSSFSNANKRHNTELSKYIWYLKDKLTKFKVTWRILKHAASYNPTSNRCNLCLWEKYFIICKPDLASLNKRNELISSCRYAGKYALKNFTP